MVQYKNVIRIDDVKRQINAINRNRKGVNLIIESLGEEVNPSWKMFPCKKEKTYTGKICTGIISIKEDGGRDLSIIISLICIHRKQETYIIYDRGYNTLSEKYSLNCTIVSIWY